MKRLLASTWLLACAALLATSPRARAQDAGPPAAPAAEDDDDDEIIIIEDDEPAAQQGSAGDDDEIIIVDEDDDEIVIVDEDGARAPAGEPAGATGALGRLWDSWHVATDSDLTGVLQLTEPEDGPWRLLGGIAVETWVLPAPSLSFYANGFGRFAVDGGGATTRVLPFADVYEAYAKVSLKTGSVQVGRLIVPWGRTQVASLGDRLNAPDLRRGPTFPDAGRQMVPAWGAWLRTSLGAVAVEGVLFAAYEPPKGGLAAVNQGGVRPAQYQLALVGSPSSVDGLLRAENVSQLDQEYPLAASAVLGARAKRRLGEIDVGSSIVWGFDDVPTLRLPPDVARFLAAPALAQMGVPAEELPSFPCASVEPDGLSCLGGEGAVTHARTASVAVDASWGLGIVILRGEVLAHPALFGLPGKTAILVDEQRGLHSTQLGHYGAALAVEGAIGDWLSGSIEIFDLWWNDVPAGSLLYGVESFGADVASSRIVHRLALGAALSGALMQDRMRWRVRGEGGLLQPDLLMSADVRYRLPVLNLYVGGRTDVFTGVAGSPGWLRRNGTLVGVFVGEGV